MANLQAIGVDGLTTVFLWATGTGTDQDPYKSNFYAYQGGDWAIAVNNFPSVFDVGNFPLTFAATQSGNWSVSVDNFPATVAVTGTFWQATQPVSFGSLPAGSNVIGNIGNTTFDIGNFPATQAITASALPLPTGASTSAKQDTGNNSLSSIDTKLPSNLTVTSTRLLVDGSGVTQPISGTVTANTGLSQPLTDAQLRAAAVPVSGTFWPTTQLVSFGSLPAGSNVIGNIGNTTFDIGNFPSTQAITASSLPLPSGASTASNQSTIIGHVDGIEGLLTTIDADTSLLSSTITSSKIQVDVKTAPTITVSDGGGSLTIDGTVELGSATLTAINGGGTTEITNDVGNPIPVSASSLPLPSGASTSAKQDTGNSSLSSIDGKLPSNLTVTSARLLVDGSGVTQPISGTVTANTGLSQPLTDAQLRASAVPIVEGLSIPSYDYMSLTYSNSNLSQVIYRTGGVNGTIVATLNLSYDLNNNVTSITKV